MPLDALLAANQAFYEAFNARDVQAMDACWAQVHTVVCGHPGWPLLVGREQVLGSFRAILGAQDPPKVKCTDARAMQGGGLACVICTEEVGSSLLLATNVFVLEDGLWRMVHHHASAVQMRPRPMPAPGSGGGWVN